MGEQQSSQQVNLLRNLSFFEFILQTFLRTLSYLGKCAKLIKFEGEYEYFYASKTRIHPNPNSIMCVSQNVLFLNIYDFFVS